MFTGFLFDTGPVIGGTAQADSQPLGGPGPADYKELVGLSVGGEGRRTCTSPDLAGLEVVITPSLSIDTTPVLTPETNMEHSDPDVPAVEARDDAVVSELNLVSLVSGMSELETEEAGSVLPGYIRVAAEHISSELRFPTDHVVSK